MRGGRLGLGHVDGDVRVRAPYVLESRRVGGGPAQAQGAREGGGAGVWLRTGRSHRMASGRWVRRCCPCQRPSSSSSSCSAVGRSTWCSSSSRSSSRGLRGPPRPTRRRSRSAWVRVRVRVGARARFRVGARARVGARVRVQLGLGVGRGAGALLRRLLDPAPRLSQGAPLLLGRRLRRRCLLRVRVRVRVRVRGPGSGSGSG